MDDQSPTDIRRERTSTGSNQATSIPDHVLKTVGALVRKRREMQRLTQTRVAELSGGRLARTTISSIERGKNLPSAEALVSLARVLHLDASEILEQIDLGVSLRIDITGRTRAELYDEAKEAFRGGKYYEAVAIYDAIFQQFVLLDMDDLTDEAEQALEYARIEIHRSVALRRCGALSAARSSARRAIQLTGGDPALQARAYMTFGGALRLEGDTYLALDAAGRAVELVPDHETELLGQALNGHGNALFSAGKYEEAWRTFLRAQTLARTSKDRLHEIKIEGNLGACLLGLGRRTQARTRFSQAVKLARKYKNPAAEAFWIIELGRMRLDDGGLDEADNYAQEALRIAKPLEQTLTIFRAEWLRHLVAKQRDSKTSDRHRIQYLTKLYVDLKDHQGVSVIDEFRRDVLDADSNAQRGSR